MVVFLLIGSTAFTLVFRGLYGDIWIEDFLVNLPGGKCGLIVISHGHFCPRFLHRLFRNSLYIAPVVGTSGEVARY